MASGEKGSSKGGNRRGKLDRESFLGPFLLTESFPPTEGRSESAGGRGPRWESRSSRADLGYHTDKRRLVPRLSAHGGPMPTLQWLQLRSCTREAVGSSEWRKRSIERGERGTGAVGSCIRYGIESGGGGLGNPKHEIEDPPPAGPKFETNSKSNPTKQAFGRPRLVA